METYPSHYRPKVVLDIAPVAFAFHTRSHSRGVHRVATRLFEELTASGECDLRFVATSFLSPARGFLATHGSDCVGRLHSRPSQLALSAAGTKAKDWVEATLGNRTLPYRSARFLLQRSGVWADTRSESISAEALAGADIYHSPLAPIPATVRLRSSIRRFVTIHDLIPLKDPQSVKGKGVELITKTIESMGDDGFAFCVSQGVKDDLLHYSRLRPANIFVTHLAADADTFRPVDDACARAGVRTRYKIPDAPYFLTLSSFDPRKNFHHVIECFAALVSEKQAGECNLVIAGANPERNSFVFDAIQRHPNLNQRVILPGYIPDCDLAAIYSGALAFVFPSLGEGFGIPPLEAMQCGTPVISSNAPVLPEILGDAAILLNPNDRDAWCQALKNIASNESLRRELSRAGVMRAKCFTWERFIESTLAGYRASLR